MNTNVFLVRHAHSDYTPEELTRPLSTRGLADAERVTAVLLREGVETVVTSPYLRARQTVSGTAHALGLQPIVDARWRERSLACPADIGFEEAITRVWREPAFAWDGGESNDDAQARAVTALQHVLAKFAGKNVAVGTHGNMLALLLGHFDSAAYDFSFWRGLHMPDIYALTFDVAGLSGVRRVSNTTTEKDTNGHEKNVYRRTSG